MWRREKKGGKRGGCWLHDASPHRTTVEESRPGYTDRKWLPAVIAPSNTHAPCKLPLSNLQFLGSWHILSPAWSYLDVGPMQCCQIRLAKQIEQYPIFPLLQRSDQGPASLTSDTFATRNPTVEIRLGHPSSHLTGFLTPQVQIHSPRSTHKSIDVVSSVDAYPYM